MMNSSEKDWADIVKNEWTLDGPLSIFDEVSYEVSQSDIHKDYVNVAHAMIFARDNSLMKLEVTDNLPRPKHAAVLVS